jgi:hypothetical protein
MHLRPHSSRAAHNFISDLLKIQMIYICDLAPLGIQTRDVQYGEMNETNRHFRSKIHEYLLFVVFKLELKVQGTFSSTIYEPAHHGPVVNLDQKGP